MPELAFQATPGWYGTKELTTRAEAASRMPFQRYEGDRIAPFNPQQQQAFQTVGQEAVNPVYGENFNQATGVIRNASGQNIMPQLQPYLNQATANPTINAQQYMNPYQDQVVNQIGQLGSRNLQENILPNIKDKFIGAGQYGSSGHQNFANRAVRDTQEAVTRAQAEALKGGYDTALQTSVGQQERNLQTGRLLGSTSEEQARRGILGGETLQKISADRQNQGIKGAGALAQFGGMQQQQAQQGLNTAYGDWQEEQAFPHLQLERFGQIQRGLPVTNYQQYASKNPATAPGASPLTQGAGLLAGLIGAGNQGGGMGAGGGGGFGFAKGGHVSAPNQNILPKAKYPPTPKPSVRHLRHYGEGGQVSSPIQRGVNDAMDTAEIHHMRNEAMRQNRPQVDPFWASIARAGFNVAANRQPGVMAAIGEGANAGLDEYNKQLGSQDARGLESARIMSLIQNTRDAQAKQQQDYEMDTARLSETKRQHEQAHGLAQAKFGLDKEKFAHEKQFIKGANGALFKLGKDEEGIDKLIPVNIEGQENMPQSNPEYEKARAKHEAKQDVELSSDISKKADGAYKENKQIDKMLQVLPSAKAGVGFEGRKALGNALQSLGMEVPENLGDPSSMAIIKKGLVNFAMTRVKNLSSRPTNFDLQTQIEGLAKGSDSPETVDQILKVIKAENEYEIQKESFKKKWIKKAGSLSNSIGDNTFEESYRKYADDNIWPELQQLNEKYARG